MRTITAVLTTAFVLFNSVVDAVPATSPGRPIDSASKRDAAASHAIPLNGTALNETAMDGYALNGTTLNGTGFLAPYPTQQCGIHQPAPNQDCIMALIQFPSMLTRGVFHPRQPHDPDPQVALGQVEKSGRCRIFINLLNDKKHPTWSWDQLVNCIWGMIDSCTENKRDPTAQWITGGDLQIRFLDTFEPDLGFNISVRSTMVDGEDGEDEGGDPT